MEIIERYVYAVVSKLPENQRDDIREEIKTLIEDMKEKYPSDDEETKVKKILVELGDPNLLAERYRGTKRYIIGPKNYNQYMFILKIVLGSILIAITVASLIQVIFVSDSGFFSHMASYISSLFYGLLQGFAWVTIIFAIMEYQGVVVGENQNKTWSLKSLPKIPNKNAKISRLESILGILFLTIFTFVLYFFPEILGFYIVEEGIKTVIPIFNLNHWESVSILLLVIFLIGITREVLKLIYGKWNIKLSIYYTILSLVSLILIVVFFINPHVWNNNFITEIKEVMNIENGFDVSLIKIKSIIIWVFVILNVVDIISVIYKGVKYNDYA